MDLPFEPILILRGLLTKKTEIEEEIFYHPERMEIDVQNTFEIETEVQSSESGLLVIDLGYGEHTNTDITERIKHSLDHYKRIKGEEPNKIILKDIASVTIKKIILNGSQLLQNKVALVTGAAGAIGYGICKRLLEEGCLVMMSDIIPDKLNQVVSELDNDFPGKVRGVQMDVTEKESVRNAFDQINRLWGGTDIVVINAGIALVASLINLDLKDFQRLEKVNVEGTLLTLS
jgi:hypothetical protein